MNEGVWVRGAAREELRSVFFYVRSQSSREKWLLASSCLSVRLPEWNVASHSGRIYVKLM